MRAGRMRDWVHIMTPSQTADTFNDYTQTWSIAASVHAKITPKSVAESDREGQGHPTSTHEVMIRYRAGTTPEQRLLVRRYGVLCLSNMSDSTTTISLATELFPIGEGTQANTLDYRLQIENEFVKVTQTDSAGTTLTIERGVDGTTAAAHSPSTTVYLLSVMNIDGPPVDPSGKRRYMRLNCTEVI